MTLMQFSFSCDSEAMDLQSATILLQAVPAFKIIDSYSSSGKDPTFLIETTQQAVDAFSEGHPDWRAYPQVKCDLPVRPGFKLKPPQ